LACLPQKKSHNFDMRICVCIHSGISRIICLILLVILAHPVSASDGDRARSEYELSKTINLTGIDRDDRFDMISDFKGNIYLLQSNLNRVLKISPSAKIESEIGAFGFGVGQFNIPTAISTNDGGLNIYVLDSENRRIIRLNSDLKWLDQISIESAYNEQPIGELTGLALNSLGEFYVSDPRNFRILKFDSEGRLLSRIESRKKLIEPGRLVVDDNDYLYACDLSENIIRVFDDLGNQAGSLGQEILRTPARIAYSGNKLYVLDSKLSCVIVFTLTQKQIEYEFISCITGNMAALSVYNQSVIIFDPEDQKIRIYKKREK